MSSEEVFERLITESLRERIDKAERDGALAFRTQLGPQDATHWLAQLIHDEVARALTDIGGHDGDHERLHDQISLSAQMLEALRAATAGKHEPDFALEPLALLKAISQRRQEPELPLTGLTQTRLLTNRTGPRLGTELEREFATATEVDAIVSFVRRSGHRTLQGALERFANEGRRFRLLTTVYTGATEADAILELARRPKVEIKISYDTRRSRLHAKAWLFRRPNGLSTVFVGSANLSSAALSSGLEWTIKAAERSNPDVVEAFRSAFDTLWEDGEFELFDPRNDKQCANLKNALRAARGENGAGEATERKFFFLLHPYPFQQAILDRLAAEREAGRARNLVVSATGTGKTVIAAFDYRRVKEQRGVKPRLLFVAHRDEILKQARDTFREVLQDGEFGERLGSGNEPHRWEHVFANIQSLASQDVLRRFGPKHFHFVIVDEVHRGAAKTYRALLDQIDPEILVGLTATPERTDGQDILAWFGGQPSAQIRLWDALDRRLLAPFEYFGIADSVSLAEVEWTRGGYNLSTLSNLYTGNDARVALVIKQLQEKYGDPALARGLGFCVSVEHAEFMAQRLKAAGIKAEAVHGGTPEEVRAGAPVRLARHEVNFLFTCDLYNEGVDIPEVDVLLLLRPTESVLLFQQQLGRGLRLHEGKESVLVLDFIGQHRREFRFKDRLRALTGRPASQQERDIQEDFPFLPPGCSLQLDAVARQIVLDNVKAATTRKQRDFIADLVALADRNRGSEIGLRDFLEATDRDLADIYAKNIGGWTTLRRAAGLVARPRIAGEADMSRRLGGLLHEDDPALLASWRESLDRPAPDPDSDDGRRLQMLSVRIEEKTSRSASPAAFLARLDAVPEIKRELDELLDILAQVAQPVPHAAMPAPEGWLLSPYRRYSREEILIATGAGSWANLPPFREGVFRIQEQLSELMLVTLDKSDDSFTATTSYKDFALSEKLFHWQSQSGTNEDSPVGRQYRGLSPVQWAFHLFVRERRNDDVGRTAAYVYLGPTEYLRHEGSRPMSITWNLKTPIPARMVESMVRYRAG